MKKQQLYIVAYMVSVAAVFGAMVTGLHLASRPALERNARLLRQRALIRVFSLGDAEKMPKAEAAQLVEKHVDATELRRDPESGWEFRLLKAYGDAGKRELKAYGFQFRGLGFWAPIEGVLAVSPDLNRTVGLVILDQKETPGLGGRVAEPEFTDQFGAGIDVSPPRSGDRFLQLAARGTGAADAARARRVDAITGATQTSTAMERILNQHLARFRRAMETR